MTTIFGGVPPRPITTDQKPFEPRLDDVQKPPSDLQRRDVPGLDLKAPNGKQQTNTRGGVWDDTTVPPLGKTVAGETSDPATRDEIRAGIAQKLERPSYLREAVPLRPQRLDAAIAELNRLLTPRAASSLVAEAKANGRSGAHLEKLLVASSSLPPALRQSLVKSAGQGLGGTAGAVISNVVASDAFRALSLDQKQKLASVIERLTDKDGIGLERLGAIVEGAPAALSSKDAKGGTLIDNLAKIATEPFSARLVSSSTPEKLLAALLQDVANPNSIDQGNATTCTTASMQFEMVTEAPAEFARLVAGLATKGEVAMQGGDKLALSADRRDDYANARLGRTQTEALFQSATMEYANGKDEFRPISSRSTDGQGRTTRGGLTAAQQQRVLSQLFGVQYATKQLPTEEAAAAALQQLRGFDSRKQVNRPVILMLDAGAADAPGPNGEARRNRHAVALEAVKDGRVYFRDPHGSLRSFPEDRFAKNVLGVLVPPGVM